ncbi:hypothetical protein A5745_18725 [Mycobacterium sp. IS-2888]|uniref:hypothetical protein n=1 Tax=Mycobacterium sp. IS-2888 TaxID=1834159 RepID=UPI00096DA725|nr:hypothetical protein A5745_18725 [Mycobacterium sp. IS-2888]
MLACVFAGEFVAAAASQSAVHPAPDAPQRPTPPAASAPMVVRDRAVRLLGGGGPATDRLLSRIASNIGAAVDAVETFWGIDWPRDISVVATGSDDEFRAAAGGGPAAQWADIAAVTVVDRVDPAHRAAVGQRIVFAPGAANMTEPALRIVLTHELFHYAARIDTALDAPRWLTEGVADFVARPPGPVPAEAAEAVVALPSDADLDTPGPQRSSGYDRAWWFARFVADTYGAAKLRAFYLAACGAGHADVPGAVRDVLGTDPAALLARWKHWLVL